MKNITKIFAIALVALGFSATSFAQTVSPSSTATADATASILTPILITKNADLGFGTIGAVAGSASTVVVSNTGVRTSATATLFTVASTPVTNARFTITGTPNALFAITLPATDVSLTSTSVGATAMTIPAASWSSDLGVSSTILNTGSKVLNLGATLNVGAGQTAGTYSGSFDVTVAYN